MGSREGKHHRCPFCSYKFNYKSQMEHHMRQHTGEKPFKCDQCHREFTLKSNLHQHIRHAHQGLQRKKYEKKHKCSLCSFATTGKHSLEIHTRKHTGERSFPCQHSNCEYIGKSYHHLEQHIHHRHTNERQFLCQFPDCDYKGKNKAALQAHSVIHSDDRPFVCDFARCSYRAKRKDMLSYHKLRVHNGYKPVACSMCNYRATCKSSLKTHELIHTEEKSISCTFSECTYSCKTKRSLNYHVLKYHTEKVFKCDIVGCSVTMASEVFLKNHKKKVHHEKVHDCRYCDYQTAEAWMLRRHIQIHSTSQKRYTCPNKGCTFMARQRETLSRHMVYHRANLDCPVDGCGFVRTSKSNWERHMQLHDATARPFHCPLCPKHFSTNFGLSVHVHSHTKEKPFKCPACDYGSVSEAKITIHVLGVHSAKFPGFVFDTDATCDHCNLNYGCAVGLAMHRMKLETAVVVLPRLQLK